MPRLGERLVGKTAVVTGGGHGIGREYCRGVAREGAKVVVAEIDAEAASSLAEELREEGFEALGATTDVSDEHSLQGMVETTMEAFGSIDILVTNAAIFATIPIARVPFGEISPEEWDKVMDVNVKGVWLSCRAVAPVMMQQNSGKIINVSSSSVFQGHGGRAHYVASKAAILGLTKTMARDLGDYNINVNCIAPGSTLSAEEPSSEQIAYRESRVSGRAIKRVQVPKDLVGLMEESSQRVRGFVFDGGMGVINALYPQRPLLDGIQVTGVLSPLWGV